jgi:Trp operon repressor
MVLTLTSIEQEKLADRISLFKRGNELVYENELVGGEWKNTPDVSNALKGERSRRWSKQEWKVFVEAYEDLEALLRRPERGASTEELRVIQGLLSKAQSERDNSLGLGQRR